MGRPEGTDVSRSALVSAERRLRAARRVFAAACLAMTSRLLLASVATAASPGPTGGTGGDPRSSGQGPGLVGDPLFALVVVLAIGLGALVLTLSYIRMTGRRDT